MKPQPVDSNELARRLAQLKADLVNSDDFYKVFTYFFDYLGDSDEFLDASKPRHNKALLEVLGACARSVLKEQRIVARNTLILYYAPQKFYHGASTFNGIMTNFFYFQDINAGLLAMVMKPTQSDTVILRFSMEQVGKPPRASRN